MVKRNSETEIVNEFNDVFGIGERVEVGIIHGSIYSGIIYMIEMEQLQLKTDEFGIISMAFQDLTYLYEINAPSNEKEDHKVEFWGLRTLTFLGQVLSLNDLVSIDTNSQCLLYKCNITKFSSSSLFVDTIEAGEIEICYSSIHSVTLNRENNLITFPQRRYIDGKVFVYHDFS